MTKTLAVVLTMLYVALVAGTGKLLKHLRETQSKPLDPKADLAAYYRRGVEVAGGEYVGIQECEGMSGLVLFNSRKTGSTLAVKETNFTAVAVQNRLEQHEHEWGIE